MNMVDPDPETARRFEVTSMSFFRAGIQYYVSGRYAVIAGLSPVAGNLLHHAVEMFLKGGLSQSMELKQLKDLGHVLPRIWVVFKERLGRGGLDQFDTVINSLNVFEELRYPDTMITRGAQVMIAVTGHPGFTTSPQVVQTPSYELYLSAVDSLVGAIFEAASTNPAFFTALLRPQAREYLRDTNSNPWTA